MRYYAGVYGRSASKPVSSTPDQLLDPLVKLRQAYDTWRVDPAAAGLRAAQTRSRDFAAGALHCPRVRGPRQRPPQRAVMRHILKVSPSNSRAALLHDERTAPGCPRCGLTARGFAGAERLKPGALAVVLPCLKGLGKAINLTCPGRVNPHAACWSPPVEAHTLSAADIGGLRCS